MLGGQLYRVFPLQQDFPDLRSHSRLPQVHQERKLLFLLDIVYYSKNVHHSGFFTDKGSIRFHVQLKNIFDFAIAELVMKMKELSKAFKAEFKNSISL